jgi:hypothetical protein
MVPYTLRNPSSIGEDRKPVPVNMSLIYYSHTTQKKNRMQNHKSKNKLEKKKIWKRTPFQISIADSSPHIFIAFIYVYKRVIVHGF